ncbi:Thivi_2564 family membrane protein [Microcystis aeruginosa]|nr:Thivi_2564 family membrane protein [Microcystis aeruginosa]
MLDETHEIGERRSVMDLVQFMVVIIVVGVLLWLVNNYIPMDSKIKQILNIVVVIALVLWILKVFGLLSFLKGIRIGR